MFAAIRNVSLTRGIARQSATLTSTLRAASQPTSQLVAKSLLPSSRHFSRSPATFGLRATLPTHSEAAAAVASSAEEVEPQPVPQESNRPPAKEKPIKDSTFASLKGHISYPTWKALTNKPFNFKEMSPVQERVLHLLPELAHAVGRDGQPMPDGQGRDLLVKAKTGTGKTVAFLVPAIESRIQAQKDVLRSVYPKPWAEMLSRHRPDLDVTTLDKHGRQSVLRQFNQNTVGALILSPTRELATQIANEAKKLLTHHDGLQVQLLVGGASRKHQINDWRRGRPDIVVATPGRLVDLMNDVGMIREAMSATRTLIFDEADTLLELGFAEDMKKIVSQLPPKDERHTMLFSATVSSQIRSIASQSLERNHRFIDCVPAGEENVHQHIPQYATVVNPADQMPHVLRLIAHDQLVNPGNSKVIVFAPTTRMTQLLSSFIHNARHQLPTGRDSKVYELHSQKSQESRFKASGRFRNDKSGASILVTSDVSARGVDYPGTTRVIQVGAPSNKNQYIHRIGRTGRAGAQGRGDIVLLNWEQGFLHYQLDDLPMKTLSTTELAEELEQLSEEFDSSPEKFASPQPKPADRKSRSRGQESDRPARIQGPLSGRFSDEDLVPKVQDLFDDPDRAELVREAFTSMLGHYIGITDDLRTSKGAILQGLKRWTVEAGQLESEPYLSDGFIQKMGLHKENRHASSRSGRGGGGRGGDYGRRSSSFGGDRGERSGRFERRSSSFGGDRGE